MRTLILKLYDTETDRAVSKEIPDTAIKQCLYGRPFDLLAEIQDLGMELNRIPLND